MPRSAPGPSLGRPSMSTVPSVASSSPARMRSNVDFPHPDGPISVRNSWLPISRWMSLSAVNSDFFVRYTLPRPEIEIRVSAGDGFTAGSIGATSMRAASPNAGSDPRERPFVQECEQPVAEQAQEADDNDAGENLVGV